MSVFANPAGTADADAAAYTRALLEILGDRDPFAVMAELPSAVEAAVRPLADDTLRRPERPGKWSIIEIVQHLADTEIVYGYRVRMIISHETPPIQGYDQDAWARSLRYHEVALSDALSQLRVLRGINLGLLRTLDEAQLDRVGLHSERGPESVRHIMRMIAAHDLVHRRQIARVAGTVARG